MINPVPSESSSPDDRVHLEKCKICGEWINRLNLEEVVQHLDHSRLAEQQNEPAVSGTATMPRQTV